MARDEPAVLTVKDLATLLRCSERHVRECLIRGEIPGGQKLGAEWRISAVAVDRWLHQRDGAERDTTDMQATIDRAVVDALDGLVAGLRHRLRERESGVMGNGARDFRGVVLEGSAVRTTDLARG